MTEAITSSVFNGRPITVSSSGRIWRESGTEAARFDGGFGYLRSRIYNKDVLVHRIVWEAFCGPVPGGMQIDHIDGDKTNNRLSNLRCVTPSENTRHYYQRMRAQGIAKYRYGKKIGIDNARLMRRLFRDGATKKALSVMFGITRSGVRNILSNRNYKHAA